MKRCVTINANDGFNTISVTAKITSHGLCKREAEEQRVSVLRELHEAVKATRFASFGAENIVVKKPNAK